MVELFPEGFEEIESDNGVELVAYTDASGEERLRAVFQGAAATDVADDWAERWRRFHRPVRVGDVWIGPPWERPPDGGVAVVVDPGRAFGTGGHATTRLCVELVRGLPQGSLLDLGCGSGVISVVAAKLGFAPVVALDHEPQAIEATRRNAEANSVVVEARLAQLLDEELPSVDLAVANIDHATVRAVAPRVRAATLVASGYVEAVAPGLPGFAHVERRKLDGWAADVYAPQ